MMSGNMEVWAKVIAIIMTVAAISFGVDMMVSHERIGKLEKELQACKDTHTPPDAVAELPLQQCKVICGKDDREICQKECGEYYPPHKEQIVIWLNGLKEAGVIGEVTQYGIPTGLRMTDEKGRKWIEVR